MTEKIAGIITVKICQLEIFEALNQTPIIIFTTS